MVFDVIVLAFVAILAVVGYFKGFLNQFFTFVGIIGGYLLSPKWTYLIEGLMRDLLPFSYIITDMFSRLIIGIIIFAIIKIGGKFIEFMFAAKFKEFSSLNNWGGLFFGFLKAVMIIFILMSFMTLLPEKVIKKRFTSLPKSATFKISKRFNPVINPDTMENIRRLASLSKNRERLENISNSIVYNDYLKTKNMENPLKNNEILKKIRRGDIEFLKKNGIYKYFEDKDFMDFIYGEKYYKTEGEASENKSNP